MVQWGQLGWGGGAAACIFCPLLRGPLACSTTLVAFCPPYSAEEELTGRTLGCGEKGWAGLSIHMCVPPAECESVRPCALALALSLALTTEDRGAEE